MHHVTKQINGISYTIAHDGDWKGDAIIRYTDSDGSLVEIELVYELFAPFFLVHSGNRSIEEMTSE